MYLTISVERMKLRAFHGVSPQERAAGNIFEVTVRLRCPLPTADNIGSTVSYADIAEIIRMVMARPADLIETVAMALHDQLAARFPQVSGGEIVIAKLTPPLRAEMAAAAATLTW